jgi:tetratricopeptide (TPR) repeat protein
MNKLASLCPTALLALTTCGNIYASPESDKLLDNGDKLIDSHQYKSAVAELTKAIAANSSDATAYDDRACALNKLTQYKRAIDDENKSLAINDKNFLAHLNRGSAYFELRDWKNAIKDFQEANKIRPSEPSALANLGGALYKSGDHEKARDAFKQAREIYAKAGRIKEADEIKSEALQKYSLSLD